MRLAFRSDDVRAFEEPLLAAGEPLMERAAAAVAHTVTEELRSRGHRVTGSQILVLAGPGNNGGDGLFAGAYLARRGAQVDAVTVGEVHAKAQEAAVSAGVRLHELGADPAVWTELPALAANGGVWIDALTGIGQRGPLRDPIASLVERLVEERQASPAEPIVIAVDVPSGIIADDGGVPGPALEADVTVTMGVAKPGLLLPPARHKAGRLVEVDLGLQLSHAPAVAELGAADVADLLQVPGVSHNKYSRGVTLLATGSDTYPGAATLSVGGAMGAGAGMVRLMSTRRASDLALHVYPEVVCQDGRAQSFVLGSGVPTVDLDHIRAYLDRALEDNLPAVLDAGALELLHDDYEDLPTTVILTPHAGELAALLGARGEDVRARDIDAAPAKYARLAAALTGATVLLKGSVDIAAAPDGPLYAQGGAPGWRATAGAGDVLAGIIGALTASYGDQLQRLGRGLGLPARLAAAASWIHGQAATRALPGRGGPIRASQIADNIAHVIAHALEGDLEGNFEGDLGGAQR